MGHADTLQILSTILSTGVALVTVVWRTLLSILCTQLTLCTGDHTLMTPTTEPAASTVGMALMVGMALTAATALAIDMVIGTVVVIWVMAHLLDQRSWMMHLSGSRPCMTLMISRGAALRTEIH